MLLSTDRKSRKKLYIAAWYQKNKLRQNVYYSEYSERIKQEMVAAYGGSCVDCGETDYVVLLLDHINDDAKADRQANGHTGGIHMYKLLRKQNWPKGRHQLMCHNCNYRKEHRRRKDAVKKRCSA